VSAPEMVCPFRLAFGRVAGRLEGEGYLECRWDALGDSCWAPMVNPGSPVVQACPCCPCAECPVRLAPCHWE
jgi:hypothetical protein